MIPKSNEVKNPPPAGAGAVAVAAGTPGAGGASASDAPIPSASLLKGRDCITIEHNGRLYQLRKTRQGKLILTK